MHNEKIDLHDPSYTPGKLLDAAARKLGVPNDSQLAIALGIGQAAICRTRKRTLVVSDTLMVRILDRTDWTIRQVRELAGIPFDGEVVRIERRSAQRKLTEHLVRMIRNDKRSDTEVGRAYKVHPATIACVRARKTWKHVQ